MNFPVGPTLNIRSGFATLLVASISTVGALHTLGGCDASNASPVVALQTAEPSLTVEPTTLDMGDLVPDVAVVKRVTLTNRSNKPVTITSAIADCACTTPTWPVDPIAPGASVETDITMKPGPKQGVTLTKRVTFSIEGGELLFLNVVGKVGLFIEISQEMLRAPADEIAAPPAMALTLRGADGTAFRVLAIDPPVATADTDQSALTHTLQVDWAKWRDAKRPNKLSITTDHPKTPDLMVMVRRAPPQSAQVPAVRKPREYKIVLPGVYPGATVNFPPLGGFVQGKERHAFTAGKVIVFEFFSTTCGHCEEAAPVVESLVTDFSAKGFEFISVTAEEDAKVREWLANPEHGEMVKHSVALDPGSKAQKALQDATYQVLNPRFFVVRDGTVLWYGHPDVAAEPFAQIAAGTWNPDSVKAEFLTNALVARAKNQTNGLLTQCEKDGKWNDLLELFESIAAAIPDRASTFELQRFGTMIGPANMSAEGYAYGKELALRYATDLPSLRTLARTTLHSPRVQVRDLDFAFSIARAADALGKGEDARAAEIMALAYFSKGDREQAVVHQERAIRLQDNAKLKLTFEAQLVKYQKDEPKPVPYTPKPAPAVATPGHVTPNPATPEDTAPGSASAAGPHLGTAAHSASESDERE